MTGDRIESLIDISKKKLDLLTSMLKLTKKQASFIEKEDIDGVDSTIDKKERLIERIDKLDAKFLDNFTELKKENNIKDIDELDPGKYPGLKELKKLVKDITSTLTAISSLDENNTSNMKKNLEGVKANLKNVREGKRVYNGYNKTINNSIMIDERK